MCIGIVNLGCVVVEKKSYDWFEHRRRTKGLELAHEQIIKALDTVTWLYKAAKSFSERNVNDTKKYIENLYAAEEEVDKLRADTFLELSKGTALVSDYREDLLHVVKRLDTLADYTKDAARCFDMLIDATIPPELCQKVVYMTGKLVDTAQMLKSSIEKISSNPIEAVKEAKQVGEIETDIDTAYLLTKSLFVKYGANMNCGVMVIFDDLIEFIEQAADMCADTADYILVLSSRE
jgi:predicted phosphate transport protein (TIGR00153 family)